MNIQNGYKPNILGLKSHVKGEFKHNDETKKKLSEFRKGKKIEFIIGEEAATKRKIFLKSLIADKNFNYKFINIDDVIIHIKNGTKLDDISKLLKISKPTIITRFKEKTGLSITEYKIKNNINK